MTSTTTDRRRSTRARTWSALALSGALFGLLGATTVLAETSATATTAPTSTDPPLADVVSPDPAAPLPAPVAVPATFTLPLFGVGLTVDITTGPGGALSVVNLNPADGYTAVESRPNKVAFVNEDGTAKVVVKSKNGGQSVERRAGSLAAILGPGGWTGEVFPGVAGSVAFEIVDNGGAPGIKVGAVTGPTPEIGEVETLNDDEGDEQGARVRIGFSLDGQSRWLTIKATVERHDGDDDDADDEDEDEGSTEAKVRISLSKIKTAFTGVDALDPQRWDGVLCNGSPAMILFTVAEDGTLTIDDVSPKPERQKVEGRGVEVRFGRGERIRIRVRSADGSLSVKVDERIRCEDAPDPTLNVPVAGDDDNDDDADHDGNEPGHDRRGKGGDDRPDDGAAANPTETTTPSEPSNGSGSDD